MDVDRGYAYFIYRCGVRLVREDTINDIVKGALSYIGRNDGGMG
jgi:hypothetical protein